MDQIIVHCEANGAVLTCTEGMSFWGGVNAQTGVVQDAHHPQFGQSLAGKIVLMPTSRGSCSGSGVLLELALNGNAPAALVFHEAEDILTLGALISARMFDRPLAVLQLSKASYARLSACDHARIEDDRIVADGESITLERLNTQAMTLTPADKAMLMGVEGEAVQLAMEVIQIMGAAQGAARLIDVSRVHIDGCIYAGPANLTFAAAMEKMGARVKIPTTMNAISVDFDNWQDQGVPALFGTPASQLASAYVSMGARPTFTCAPYLAEDRPKAGEDIGWSESNAVIFANSVLGARTAKHPDFFDLFIALTGRAPLSDVYLPENRQARVCITIDLPENYDEAIWPLIGWVAGQQSPDQVPRLEGLGGAEMNEDDLKALCAAFGTTSAAPMLHIQGVTPEGDQASRADAAHLEITKDMLAVAWDELNSGPEQVDLVALGSPHFSFSESGRFAALIEGRKCTPATACIITLSRETEQQLEGEGVIEILETAGVLVLRDLCWCSISEPVFPPAARHLVTNSGKYAHYAPGLSGRTVRFASLADCARAAVEGHLVGGLPNWLK
ncbi:cis-3-hydroxy-L-proline dehydratase [Sulfitobacter sp.]|uniref:cis-3-hydroxy-L-proline dehydratase n=1 Tax=Sulfitobacter sp. TaxID=1903071 RepID=UPI003003997F